MDLRRFDIPGIVEITPTRHGDHRGYFTETFRDDWFTKNVADVRFVQENQSLSRAIGTIRGLHFQTEPCVQGKLVRCMAGAIMDYAVDIRHGSPTFGRWVSARLTADEGNQLWVPGGFAHAFCTLEPDTIIAYKVTSYYSPQNDCGLAWDDSDVAIDWPDVADLIQLSAKDRVQPNLCDLPTYFHFGPY
ncbi:dTDP-4-dehydrorhamnose 3,5-epimerase [soil metagenome]